MLSFIGATLLLGERPTLLSGPRSLVLIVAGILLVAGLTREPHRAPKVGIFFGLLTGAFIAGYTANEGWAVKVLAISPFIVDFTGNLLRVLVLAPLAWRLFRFTAASRTSSTGTPGRSRVHSRRSSQSGVCRQVTRPPA